MAREPCTETNDRVPGVARLELQAGQAVFEVRRAGAAVSIEVHPEQAEPAHVLGQLTRERARLEPLGYVGQDLVIDELLTVSRSRRS